MCSKHLHWTLVVPTERRTNRQTIGDSNWYVCWQELHCLQKCNPRVPSEELGIMWESLDFFQVERALLICQKANFFYRLFQLAVSLFVSATCFCLKKLHYPCNDSQFIPKLLYQKQHPKSLVMLPIYLCCPKKPTHPVDRRVRSFWFTNLYKLECKITNPILNWSIFKPQIPL